MSVLREDEDVTTTRLRELADRLDASDQIADPAARQRTKRALLVKARGEVDRLQAVVWREIVRHRTQL
jgi:hypothetical protein